MLQSDLFDLEINSYRPQIWMSYATTDVYRKVYFVLQNRGLEDPW
jgi:hypothetical protein